MAQEARTPLRAATPLALAICNGRMDAVMALIQAGADVNLAQHVNAIRVLFATLAQNVNAIRVLCRGIVTRFVALSLVFFDWFICVPGR